MPNVIQKAALNNCFQSRRLNPSESSSNSDAYSSVIGRLHLSDNGYRREAPIGGVVSI
jgi:hypothetical protein